MWASGALKEWHEFYVLVGTAGATLLALLFVAVSLGAGYLTQERQAATRTFMSPVVIHFTSVFFLSAVALFPWRHGDIFAALVCATALVGASVSTYITVQVVRTDLTNYLEDYLAYGLVPGLGYLALIAAGISISWKRTLGSMRWRARCCCWRLSISATLGTSRSPWRFSTVARSSRSVALLALAVPPR